MTKFTILAGTALIATAAAGVALAQTADTPQFDRPSTPPAAALRQAMPTSPASR